MHKPTDELSITLTRYQMQALRRALRKQLQYRRGGYRRGYIAIEEVYMMQAMLDTVKEALQDETTEPD